MLSRLQFDPRIEGATGEARTAPARTRSAHRFDQALDIYNVVALSADPLDDTTIHCLAAPSRNDFNPYSRMRIASAVAKVGFSFG